MKMLEILFESDNIETVKASRMMKFSLKNGENSFGVNLQKTDCEYFTTNYNNILYIGKPKSLKVGTKYKFENAEKPGIAAERNWKLTSSSGSTVNNVMKTFDEALAFIKKHKVDRFIIDPDLLKGAKPVEKATVSEPTEPEDGYFALGFWSNAYSRNDDKEYFWSGPFQDRKDALAYGKRKQDKGQPSTFRDWVKGSVTIIKGVDKFVAAAKKVKINPNVKDLYWHE